MDFESSSYFGLFSPKQRTEVVDVLTALGVRFTFYEVQETEDRLRAWSAWDESSASTLVGCELCIDNEDLELLGSKLVERFPERKFGAP